MNADDRAFDLLMAVADHTDSTGLHHTTRLVERAMDALLAETGRIGVVPVARRTAPGQPVPGPATEHQEWSPAELDAPDRDLVRAVPFRRQPHS